MHVGTEAAVRWEGVYAYRRVNGVMTEETPYNPCSRKGEVRARIATMLMNKVNRGAFAARSCARPSSRALGLTRYRVPGRHRGNPRTLSCKFVNGRTRFESSENGCGARSGAGFDGI